MFASERWTGYWTSPVSFILSNTKAKLLMSQKTNPYTVVLEANGPFGPGVQVLHQEAIDANEAAFSALHDWLGEPQDPDAKLHEIERRAYVLAVLNGHVDHALRRMPPGELVE